MKILDTTVVLKDFEGIAIALGDEELTLRKVLLSYCAAGNQMGLKPEELGTVFDLGMRIGQNQKVQLTTHEWDLLKKICDNPYVISQNQKVPLFGLIVTQQTKKLVDNCLEE